MLVPRRLLFKDEIFDLEHVSASFKVNWKRKLTPRVVYIRDLSRVLSSHFWELPPSEYSGENKPAFRNGGNRQTGIQETALAA